MADKKIIVESGSKVTIEINRRKPQKRTAGASAPGGMILPRKENDYLPRRNNPIYLNFWDLGQINNGTIESPDWQDVDFSISKPVNVDSFGFYVSTPQFSLSDYEAAISPITDVPANEWKNTFRKFDYELAERYGVDVYTGDWIFTTDPLNSEKYFPIGRDDSRVYVKSNLQSYLIQSPNWTNKGLKFPAKQTAQKFSLFCQGGFYNLLQLDYDWNRNYKVTEENDYAAEAAEFKIDSSVDFFLIPALHHAYAFDTEDAGEDINQRGRLNLLFQPLPRTHFIDGAGWREIETEYLYSPFIDLFINYNGDLTTNMQEIAAKMKAVANARIYRDQVGYQPAAGFSTARPAIEFSDWLGDGDTRMLVPEGALVMIAKKAGKTYYFWYNADTNNANTFSFFIPTYNFSLFPGD